MDIHELMRRSLARTTAYVNKVNSKAKSREKKRSRKAKAERKALPKTPRILIPNSYVNPVTLSPVKGPVVYQVTNRGTKRKNYYSKATLMRLLGRSMTNYELLMASPKTSLFKNPYTRGLVYPRNIQRVRI